MSLTLVQWENSTVTPKLDAIMYDDGSYGIVKGCAITHQGTNLLKIANGFIKIAGRLIEIAEETIQCQVSASGTVNGQLWLRLDLNSVTPAVFMTEAAAVLTPLTQNADCNFSNGIYELQLATYNIDESVITNLVETAPELERLRTALENIDLDASNVTYHSTTVEAELDKINDNLTASNDTPFRFDIQGGVYGYLKADDSFAPFSSSFKRIEQGHGNNIHSGTDSIVYTANAKKGDFIILNVVALKYASTLSIPNTSGVTEIDSATGYQPSQYNSGAQYLTKVYKATQDNPSITIQIVLTDSGLCSFSYDAIIIGS